jgi:hypothetical protein
MILYIIKSTIVYQINYIHCVHITSLNSSKFLSYLTN